MIVITSCEELRGLLEDFTFEGIGFEKTGEDTHFITYHKKRQHRADLCARVNPKNDEAELYRCNTAGEPEHRKGTFNIRRPGEVLFLLTHGLNVLSVDPGILEKCKEQINYDPAEIIPDRQPQKY